MPLVSPAHHRLLEHSRRARYSREAGFSLAETIAALVLMAAAVVLLAQSSGAGWRGIRQADASHRTILLARSLLASVGSERPLETGRIEGRESDGTTWSINIEPHGQPATLPPRLRVMTYSVAVSVLPPARAGRGGGEVTLASLKVGRRP